MKTQDTTTQTIEGSFCNMYEVDYSAMKATNLDTGRKVKIYEGSLGAYVNFGGQREYLEIDDFASWKSRR